MPVVSRSACETLPATRKRKPVMYQPGDVNALATRVRALWGDEAAAERGLAAVRAQWAPGVVAAALRDVDEA